MLERSRSSCVVNELGHEEDPMGKGLGCCCRLIGRVRYFCNIYNKDIVDFMG